jgi:hypothetical protein
MTDSQIDTVTFVQDRDGQLYIGYCPDKDAGGITLIKELPDSMLERAYSAFLVRKQATS